MSLSSVVGTLLLIVLGLLVVFQNPTPYTITLGMLEVKATVGVICVSAFGFGALTGFIAMLTRDVPRMRRLRAIGGDDEEG